MIDNVIRLEKVILRLNDDENILENKICSILGINKTDILNFLVVKKSIDARDKNKIIFVYSLDVKTKDIDKIFSLVKNKNIKSHNIKIIETYRYNILNPLNKPLSRPVVVGTGPAGLFVGLVLAQAGLKPILIERGEDVDKRSQDVETFFETGKLNPKSNIQFGEGGAGTFSDGKLYTLINDPRSKFIFEEFVKAGAPNEILYSAKPHIGTDYLKIVVKNLRKKIVSLGGEVLFNSCLTDLEILNNKIVSIEINNIKKIKVDDIVLAIGHSARDTYQMLYEKKLALKQKPFAMGLRIEHSADMINKSQFSDSCFNIKLPTASYKLVNHNKTNRSVYSFCMCPGGYVVAASSEIGKLTVNGMSEYKQDSGVSNSALLVGVSPSDFESDHPLAGIEFQRKREEKAFVAGGSNYCAPAQLVGDFLKKRESNSDKIIHSTYKPGVKLTSLDECLPDYIIEAIREALPEFDKKIKGFANPDTLLIGIEARSSSVVCIIRDSVSLQSNILGIYPAGEGAGYAGGITSSAIDGLKVAEKIIEKYI